jgi:hypothetical protein
LAEGQETIKIVINLFPQPDGTNKASVGIQKSDCDPVLFAQSGTTPAVLESIPGFIAQAEEKWATSKRNKATTFVKSVVKQAATVTTTATKTTTAAKPAEAKLQQSMF